MESKPMPKSETNSKQGYRIEITMDWSALIVGAFFGGLAVWLLT